MENNKKINPVDPLNIQEVFGLPPESYPFLCSKPEGHDGLHERTTPLGYYDTWAGDAKHQETENPSGA